MFDRLTYYAHRRSHPRIGPPRRGAAASRRPELDVLIAHLEALANGHDDTRVEVAGAMAGAWFAAPETGDAHTLIAAGLLLLAGSVDGDALADAVQAGYEGAGGAV